MTDLVDGPAGYGTQYTREKKNIKHYYNYIQNYVLKVSVNVKDGQREVVVVVRKLKRLHTPITFFPLSEHTTGRL